MKKLVLLSLFSAVLISCGSNQDEFSAVDNGSVDVEPTPSETATSGTDAGSSDTASETPDANAEPLQVDEFTLDELGGAGCGMTLWRPDRTSDDLYVFFNGLESGSMEMKMDGEMLKFTRTEGSGEEFYGQQTTQTFENEDKSITVGVEVQLGAEGETETVAVDGGRIEVNRGEQKVVFPVVGDAGC